MRTEADINLRLDEAQERYFRENRRMQNGSVSEVSSVRLEILDILERHADEDGVIGKERIQLILRELGEAEDVFEQTLMQSIEETIDKTTERAISDSMIAAGALFTLSVFAASRIRNRVRSSIIEHIASDNMSLYDRLWRLTGGLFDEIRTDIRVGILQGRSIISISRAISRTIRRGEWRIRRIVMTEGYNAYRGVIGGVAEEVGPEVVKAVRIHDDIGRRAHPDVHHHHECYRLAEQDMYGWGKGVYRPQDYFIYRPHPNCTAYFRFVLATEGGS